MKKVININFQGQVIAIEETAYELLNQYIQSLKRYFSREEGGDEIVNDIENRIAELFGNRLKLGINCITDEDVQSIVESIGRPEDFDMEYDESASDYSDQKQNSSTTATDEPAEEKETKVLQRNSNDRIIAGVCSGLAHYFKTDPVWIRLIFVVFFSILFWAYLILWIVLKPAPLESNITKRLYRNPNNKVLGGVCSGIAAYFKIDTWIPRVLFLLPLFFSLVGKVTLPLFPWNKMFNNIDFNWNFNFSILVVYVVLWIIIPKASTIKQKLKMMGEEEYIKSIRETVSDNVASVRSKNEAEQVAVSSTNSDNASSDIDVPTSGTLEMPPVPPMQRVASRPEPTPQRSGCLSAIIVFLKIILFAFVGLFGIVLVGILIAFLFTGASFIPLKSLFIDPGTESSLLLISAILLVLVPMVSITIWIVRRSMKLKSRPMIGVTSLFLWFAGIVLVGVLASKIVDKFKVESTSENKIELTAFPGDKLYVEMSPYPEDYYTYNAGVGPGSEIDDLPYYTINEDSLLFADIDLKIVDSPDSLFHLRTIASTHGSNLKIAKADIKEFNFEIIQKDSVLYLPEFFRAPIKQGFRDQKMKVEISVPAGKRVEVAPELE